MRPLIGTGPGVPRESAYQTRTTPAPRAIKNITAAIALTVHGDGVTSAPDADATFEPALGISSNLGLLAEFFDLFAWELTLKTYLNFHDPADKSPGF
ncbi:hypothetical protein GCM10009861_09490 [Neomicrococcus aestuarii]